jgi:hypothetical protein
MLLAPIAWTQRVWRLPFLTVLAPSERFCDTHNRRHKTLTDWTRQVALQARLRQRFQSANDLWSQVAVAA